MKVLKCLLFFSYISISICTNDSFTQVREKRQIFEFSTEIVLPVIGHFSSVLGVHDSLNSHLQDDKEQMIMDQLQSMSVELKTILKSSACKTLDIHYIELQSINIDKILDLLLNYAKNNANYDKFIFENNLKKHCTDTNTGIYSIYTHFKDFLENRVLSYFSTCYKYKSDDVKRWSETVEKISDLIAVLVVGCEQVFEYKTNFNLNFFFNQVKAAIEYYREFAFFEEFVKDNMSDFGLEKSWSSTYYHDQSWAARKNFKHLYQMEFEHFTQTISVDEYIELNCFPLLFKKIWSKNIDIFNKSKICYDTCRIGNNCNAKERLIENVNMPFKEIKLPTWLWQLEKLCLKKYSVNIYVPVWGWTNRIDYYDFREKFFGIHLNNDITLYECYRIAYPKNSAEECWKECDKDEKCVAFSMNYDKKHEAYGKCILCGENFNADYGIMIFYKYFAAILFYLCIFLICQIIIVI